MQLSTSAMAMIFLKHYPTTLFKETMSNLFSSFLIVCILRPWIIWSCICKWYRDSTFTFHEAIYLSCTPPSQIFLVTLKLLEKISSRDSFTLQSSTLDNLEQHKHKYLNLLLPSVCRYHIWRLVTSAPFENFILFLIILNTLLLMLKFEGAPLFYMDILRWNWSYNIILS